MKKTLLLIAMMLCCVMTMFAQNDKISYQAVVRDTENKLVANRSVEVTVNIYNGTATTATYTETQTVTTNLNGLISLQIGPDGNNAGWNSIQWSNAHIETTVKLDGTELGTLEIPFTAVPYAMYAKYTDNNVAPLDIAAQIHDTANNVRNEVNTQVNNLETEINNLSGHVDNGMNALSNRIAADSTNLVNFKAKENADSLALGTLIDAKANTTDVYSKTQTDINIHDTANVVRGEMNNKLAAKANSADVYPKTQTNINIHDTADVVRGEMNNKLVSKANTADVYSKTQTNINIHDTADVMREEMDTKLAGKANNADVYTKNEVYTKAEVDALLNELRQSMPVMAQDSFTVAQANQTEFTLKNVPHAEHVLRMYINGVMVGGSHSGVLTTTNDPTSKVVEYNANQNKNRDGVAYNLKAGDKVTIVYWYIKPTSAMNLGN